MSAVRAVLALAFAAAALLAAAREPWTRYRCNRQKHAANQLLDRTGRLLSEFQRQDVAARSLENIERCSAMLEDDWQLFFFRGRLEEVAGHRDRAMRSYQTALALEERPEIYTAISHLHFLNRQPAEATEAAHKAVLFNYLYRDEFDVWMLGEFVHRIEERKKRLTAGKAR